MLNTTTSSKLHNGSTRKTFSVFLQVRLTKQGITHDVSLTSSKASKDATKDATKDANQGTKDANVLYTSLTSFVRRQWLRCWSGWTVRNPKEQDHALTIVLLIWSWSNKAQSISLPVDEMTTIGVKFLVTLDKTHLDRLCSRKTKWTFLDFWAVEDTRKLASAQIRRVHSNFRRPNTRFEGRV